LITAEPAALEAFVAELFARAGVPEADAGLVASLLVEADLRGVASHGVGRVPIYLDRLRKRLVAAKPIIEVTEVAPAAVAVDGGNGLGFVVATRAISEACGRAGRFGIGVAFARRSNHFGMAASYLRQAIEAGFAAFVFTNASRAMPVWGGREPFLGTSPFAFGAPGADGAPPILLDMATSVVARGKIRRAAQRGEPIPEGWALDAEGRPTTDAKAAYDGLILPLGGPKGSGLSLMMEIVAGVMSGAAFGGEVANQYFDEREQDVGHAFVALAPGLVVGLDGYRARMAELVARAKACPRADGFDEILMPGEPEARLAAERLRTGVPLSAEDCASLAAEARRADMPLPAFLDGS
jgi:LDH2 family malate/lactate/ureidoglycolate dehydrogenase